MTNHLIDLYICVYDVFVLASLGLAQTVESQNEEDSWCLVSVKSGLLPAQVTDNKVENGLFFLCGEIPVLFICAFFFFFFKHNKTQSKHSNVVTAQDCPFWVLFKYWGV